MNLVSCPLIFHYWCMLFPGVQSAAVNVICELARKNPKNYLSLAPLFFKLMTSSTNNWVLIKIIKLVCEWEVYCYSPKTEQQTNLLKLRSKSSKGFLKKVLEMGVHLTERFVWYTKKCGSVLCGCCKLGPLFYCCIAYLIQNNVAVKMNGITNPVVLTLTCIMLMLWILNTLTCCVFISWILPVSTHSTGVCSMTQFILSRATKHFVSSIFKCFPYCSASRSWVCTVDA